MATVNEKMTALADAIRAKSGVTGKLSLDGMKTAVDGIEAGGASLPTLLGEHLIVHSPQTNLDTAFNFDSETVFAWFWSIENNRWEMRSVDEIDIFDGDGIYIYDSDGEYNFYSCADNNWYDSNEIPDCVNRIESRILKFTSPVSVPQEFYNWLENNSGDEDRTIYGESYALGYTDGIEAGGSSGVQYEIVTIPAGATSATYSLPHITKAVGSVNENLLDQEDGCNTIMSIYDNLVYVLWGVQSGTSFHEPYATFDSYIVTYSNGNITWNTGNVAAPITLLLIYDPNEPNYFDK